MYHQIILWQIFWTISLSFSWHLRQESDNYCQKFNAWGVYSKFKKKIKKEKILLQKRGRDNPVNFEEIHSLLNRFEVFSVNYLCRYFLTFLKTKTVPKVTVLGVTNSTARKCKQNTTKWNKIIWSVSPRGLFSTLPNIYDRALLWC